MPTYQIRIGSRFEHLIKFEPNRFLKMYLSTYETYLN